MEMNRSTHVFCRAVGVATLMPGAFSGCALFLFTDYFSVTRPITSPAAATMRYALVYVLKFLQKNSAGPNQMVFPATLVEYPSNKCFPVRR